jgi:DNA (cytosine-5)-methyltransferase 1
VRLGVGQDTGASLRETGSRASTEPASSLRPAGFDPARKRPRLLDLFCCAGGAAMGYHRAGFEVVGVDVAPQPNYPFQFIQAEALDWARHNLWFVLGFDAIHASPPCQGYSWAAKRWTEVERAYLIEPTRELLKATGLPYIIENVPGAPLENPFRLCGEMFGLNVIRHRNFETNFPVLVPVHRPHRKPIQRLAKDGSGRTVQRSSYCTVAGHGGESDSFRLEDWQTAMGIDWTTRDELTEAIPPAYTQFIGERLLAQLQVERIAA